MLIALLAPALAAPAPLADVPEVRIVASFYLESESDHREYIALQPSRRLAGRLLKSTEGSESESISSDGGSYDRHRLSVETIDGVSLGEQWRLSGEEMSAVCTVGGFEVIASPYARPGATEEDGGAPCITPLFVARLDCSVDASGAMIAVPASALEPVWATSAEAEITATERARVLSQPIVAELKAGITARADARKEGLHTELSSRTYTLGSNTIAAIEGSFYTGVGDDVCGGEDLVTRFSTVIIDGQLRAPEQNESYWLSGILDLNGDGIPETMERLDGEQQIRDADGDVLRTHTPDWCICGC